MINRFAELHDQLLIAVAVTDQQLSTFAVNYKTKLKVDHSDCVTLGDIESQLLANKPMLLTLSNLAADLIHKPDSQMDVAEVKSMLTRTTDRFNATLAVIADRRRWLINILKKREELPGVTPNPLGSWLSTARSRLDKSCSATPINRIGCEKQLSSLVLLAKEFDDWNKTLEAESSRNIGQSSRFSQADTIEKFTSARKMCTERLEKQRLLSGILDDIYRVTERVKVWSVTVTKKFGGDRSSLARIAVSDLKKACQELKLRQELHDQLKVKMDAVIESLKSGFEGERCVLSRKTEKCLMEPLADLEGKLNSIAEFLADKVKLVVSIDKAVSV